MKISQKRAFLLCNTGSYGAALARHLRAVGVEVIEINQPRQGHPLSAGRADTLDAEAAARAVPSARATGGAKARNGRGDAADVQTGQGLRRIKARIHRFQALLAVCEVRRVGECPPVDL